MSSIRQIFGVAASASYIRCGGSGDSAAMVLSALASGFGLSTGDGRYVYNLFNANTGEFSSKGFDAGSPYVTQLEGAVSSLGFGGYSNIGTSAIIYSYSNFPNIDEQRIIDYINGYCSSLESLGGGTGFIISESGLDKVVSSFHLNQINSEISAAPTTTTTKAVNYNFYDSLPLFLNPNSESQLIKDIENQYYYITGELIYSSLPTGATPCIEYYQKINTSSGEVSIRVVQNTPCIDNNSYVGPISGIRFFRKFSDGPATSGFFDTETMEKYISFDHEVLKPWEYLDNAGNLYSRFRDENGNFSGLFSGIRYDIHGLYDSINEYGFGRTSLVSAADNCNWGNYVTEGVPLMRMHQGDNQQKITVEKHSDGIHCVVSSGVHDWTGWKFAAFALDSGYQNSYKSIQTNPKLDDGRILARVLNTFNNTDENGNPVSPYWQAYDTGDGLLTYGGDKYVGYPQLRGLGSFPGFVFYQTFDNTTFPELASVVVRPAFNTGEYKISDFDLFSGIDATHHAVGGGSQAKIQFQKIITSSGMPFVDDVFRQCLSMGDNFANRLSGTQTDQENAGYHYITNTYFIDGQRISKQEVMALEGISKIGAKYPSGKYINGFTSGDEVFSLGDNYAYLITGDTSKAGEIFKYSYFPSGELGSNNFGWADSFAPTPDIVKNNPTAFEPIYGLQAVENYLPRYSSGPYLTYSSKFLYPNAQIASDAYKAPVLGFPTKVKYKISIKEETVREAYLTSGFNGEMKSIYIVRADANGNASPLDTLMVKPFVPNDSSVEFKYDYLKYKKRYSNTGDFFYEAAFPNYYGHLVNKNFIPSTAYCPQMELNSTLFQSTQTPFNQGVRYTGEIKDRPVYTGVSGQYEYRTAYEPNDGGLYWGYKGREITGEMLYCPPLFDLDTNLLTPSQNLKTSMLSTIYDAAAHIGASEVTSPVYSNNGAIRKSNLFYNPATNYTDYYGQDPFFYEKVGGRIGVGADSEGGCHTSGIVGDAWYHLSAENWGVSVGYCEGNEFHFRSTSRDKYVCLASLTSSGLKLFSRGLSYFPYNLNWQYQPFKSSSLGNIGVNVTRTPFNYEYFFDFNLKDYFSPKISSSFGGLYLSGGLNIGPFDRDVELCITGKNSIVPQGAFVLDGEILASSDWEMSSCPQDGIEGFYTYDKIALGQGGRNSKLSTFKLIPAGKTCNINVSGNGLIGITGKSIVTIRPRTCLGMSANYGRANYSMAGDFGILDNFRYIENGSEVVFDFPNGSDFSSLKGKQLSFVTKPREEVLFPVPESDFDSILNPSFDEYGNKTYSQKNPTLYYWSVKNPSGFFTGVRESTRINVTIDSFDVSEVGEVPYQRYQAVFPSGSCMISGEFGYTGQSESAIVSDGIVLSGLIGASSLSGVYEPIYVSDVLQRLPSSIYTLPSGSGIYPVYAAPSLMKKRKHFHQISGNDEYVGVFPSIDLNYNAFIWSAISDLSFLNPEIVYEQFAPADGNVFTSSFLTFSAAQGQAIGTGVNPTENVTYIVPAQYSFFDSVSTNALYNTGKCIKSGQAPKTTISSGDLSGILTSEGNTLTMAVNLKN